MAQLVRAPPCHGGGRGFEPHPGRLQFIIVYSMFNGIIAQLGEHLPYKQGVTGSSPVGPIYTSYSINDKNEYADVAQFSRNKDCVHDGNIRRTNACIDVRLMFSLYRRLHRERENEVFERHAIVKIHTPMWLNWQSS